MRSTLGKVKKYLQYAVLRRDFGRRTPSAPSQQPETHVLFPAAVPGGVGDDAMVGGACEALFSRPGRILILADDDARREPAFPVDAEYLHAWSEWRRVSAVANQLPDRSQLVILGADILDGHYSYVDAARRIRLARVSSEGGIPSRIIGFSLNAAPAPEVVREFLDLPTAVPILLRDPLSLERARRFLHRQDVRLSADVAFLLRPREGASSKRAAEFAASHRAAGRSVFGINIHELFRKGGNDVLEALCASFGHLVEQSGDCAFLLIPHDFRKFVDDRRPLQSIVARLTREASSRTLMLEDPLQAAEIKQICGVTDGVVTGRMHLAIAALGMHKPVLGVVYQGKFEGTFSHFGIERHCVMSPAEAGDPSTLLLKFAEWRAGLIEHGIQIQASLPRVNRLALANFE